MPSNNYAPSISSGTTSYSYTKPLIGCSESARRSPLNKAKDFVKSLNLGESPTAQYDREQLMRGEQTDQQKANGAMDFPAYLGRREERK